MAEVAYDPRYLERSAELVEHRLPDGAIFPVEPSSRHMRDALQTFYRVVSEGTLRHRGDSVIAAHLANCAVERGHRDEIRRVRKIDDRKPIRRGARDGVGGVAGHAGACARPDRALGEPGETTSETKLDGARLPREASPAKEAKDGQHNNNDDNDPKPGRHVILSLGACRLYGEPTRFATCAAYGRNRAPLDEHGGARLSDIAAHLRQGDYRRNG